MNLVQAGVGKNGGQGSVDSGEAFLVANQPGRAGLGDQDSAGFQPGLDDVVIFLRVEQVGGAALHWVNQVHYHHVELLVGAFQVAPSILV